MPTTPLGIPTPADSVKISGLAAAQRAGFNKVDELLSGEMSPEMEQAIRDAVAAGIASGALKGQYVESMATAAETAVFRNLVPNAGPFADAPTWDASFGTGGAGTKTFVADTAAPGSAYVRQQWTTAATSTNGNMISVKFPVTPGKVYSAMSHVRPSKNNVLGATVYFYDASGVQVGSTYFNRLYRVLANVWQKLEVTGAVAPAGAVTAGVGWSVASPSNGGISFNIGNWVDSSAFLCVEGSTLPPEWFDGRTDNAYWESEENTSPSIGVFTLQALSEPTSQAPAPVGPRAGKFSIDRRLYVPIGASLEPMRDRIAAALRGDIDYRLTCIGHSMVAGQGSVPGRMDFPRLFQRRASTGGKSTPGMVPGFNNTTVDSRITKDAAWTANGNPRGNMQSHLVTTTAGAAVTWAFDHAGTIVEIYTFGNSAPLTYSIDGGTAVTITPSGESLGQRTTITGLANTTHTVTITATVDGTSSYVLGVALCNATGLQVSNMGYSGSIASDWKTGGRFYDGFNNITKTLTTDGVIVRLGANELIHNVGAASLATNLQDIVAGLLATGKDVLLMVDPPMTNPLWEKDFYPVIYNIADTNKVPVLDFTAEYISRDLAESLGLFFDTYHPNPKGYSREAELLALALLLGLL